MRRTIGIRAGIALVRLAAVAASAAPLAVHGVAEAEHSIAREWNETNLAAIRRDLVRPPVQARNLFHVSVAMYDAWACYEPSARGYLCGEKIVSTDVDGARRESISYAAYRVMRHRYSVSPNAATIRAILDARMAALGYPIDVTTTVGDSPAALGNRIAALIIAHGLADGSREATNHASAPGTYVDVNPPLVIDLPFNPDVVDVTRYQPLALDFFIDQAGNVIPGGFPPKVCPFWGFVTPFGLTSADQDPARPGVLAFAGVPPVLNGAGNLAWRAGHEDVVVKASILTPDGSPLIDVSPAAMGNNPLGTDAGTGRAINPVTGRPYAPNPVKVGDWARCLAEFWADGPNSTTPPGHWNEVANVVVDHPAFERRWGGKGPELDALEWDVRMYVTLNGALHDAAIGAWGLKGHYDTMRPIGAIRRLAQNGQSSDPTLPNYSPDGIRLVPGTIELITKATTAPGQRHEELSGYEGQVATLAWPGAPVFPEVEYSGVRWILGGMWVPYQRPTFVTPPFAGFVSGHSTFSRAAAEALTRMTGSEYFPGGMGVFHCAQGDFLVFEDGPSESFDFQWATYYDAADNSGQSRIYGGIHPPFDDYPGRMLGSEVAIRAFARAETLFEPLPVPCDADLDGDGTVAALDLAFLLGAWGAPDSAADLNRDGQVDAGDLADLLAAWGLKCP